MKIQRPGPARAYYYFLLGALGGLTGWLLTGLLVRQTARPTIIPLLEQGAILGGLIGFSGGVYDGIAAGSLSRTLRFGRNSLLLGLAAGCFAMPLAQIFYSAAMAGGQSRGAGGLTAGVACWILFGALIGLGEGIGKGSQIWKGALGGAIGGALGGLFYESVGRAASRLGNRALEQIVLALAVLLLGGFIGAAVALVSAILKDTWLLVQNGKLMGRKLPISKYVGADPRKSRPGIIGSIDGRCDIHVPDQGVLPQHATLAYEGGIPTLRPLPDAIASDAVTRVNGRTISSSWPLADGDKIQIGPIELIYRTNLQAKEAKLAKKAG